MIEKTPIPLSKSLATAVMCAMQIGIAGTVSYLAGGSIREKEVSILSLEGLAGYGYYTLVPLSCVLVLIVLIIAAKKSIPQLHWGAKVIAAITVAIIILGIAQSFLEGRYNIGI